METELKFKGKLGSESDNGGGNDDDPHYAIFLASTIQKGTSYMSKLVENGLPLFIHYEKEDGCGDSVVSLDHDDGGGNDDDVCRRRAENNKKGHNDNGEVNDDDPHYAIFLASTIQKGTSYMSKLEENGLPLFIHYEKEDGCGDSVVCLDHDDGGGNDDDVCRRRAENNKKGHNDNGEVNDDDSHYAIFLASTIQKGTSYMSKLEENGLPLFIHYEKEDGFGDSVVSLDHDDGGRNDDDVCMRRAENNKKDHNDNGGGNDDDPHYAIFLASTIQKGTSYVSKLEENGLPLFIHYEKEDGCGDEPDDVCRRRLKNIEKRHKAKENTFRSTQNGKNNGSNNGRSTQNWRIPGRDREEENIDDDSFVLKNICSNNGRSTQNWRISGQDRGEENIDDDYLVLKQNMPCENCVVQTSFSGNRHMECGFNHSEGGKANQNNDAKVCKERSPNPPGNQRVECDFKDWEEENIDEDYLAFLQGMTDEKYVIKASFKGNQLMEYGHSERMTDEKYVIKASFEGNQLMEYGQSEDVEVVEVIQNNYALVCKEKSQDIFIPSKEYVNLDETCTLESPFREEIRAILKRPYNQSEYEKLWNDVKVRKPIERNMDLRDRPVSYHTKKIGMSYLDHYKDLKKRLKKVRRRSDKHKKLNILRGFYFWLQNVPDPDVFPPWNDPECLGIVPESC